MQAFQPEAGDVGAVPIFVVLSKKVRRCKQWKHTAKRTSAGVGFLKTYYRGDIYYADLRPVVGSEQGGIRPVVILQNNVGTRYSPTVIAAPITSRRKTNLPTHVSINRQVDKLRCNSVILMEQIRTIDKSRLMDRIGVLNDYEMQQVNQALGISVGLV
mgnify:CR=1 FL=1